jgi:hypothetical protein
MINRTSLLCVALLLTIPILRCHAAEAQLLIYSPTSSLHQESILLRSRDGIAYRLSLAPDVDIENRVIVIDLALDRIGSGKHMNLLEPKGRWHGSQPFFFVASDFAPGARSYPDRDLRIFNLSRLGLRLRVEVVVADVKQNSAEPSTTPEYQFENLTLDIMSEASDKAVAR